jgi:hypothetical protein
LVRLATEEGSRSSFQQAAQTLNKYCGLELGAKQVQRVTERLGREWLEERDREVEAYKQGQLPRLYHQAPQAGVVMVDGGSAQTRAAEAGPGVSAAAWAQPKYGLCATLATSESSTDPQPDPPAKFRHQEKVKRLVTELHNRGGAQPPTRVAARKAALPTPPRRRRARSSKKRLRQLLLRTMVASLASAEEFGYMLAAEVHRRGLDLAQRKAYVCDGLPYNWSIWEEHFKPRGFLPILDFVHLLSYLYAAAQATEGNERKKWERYVRWLTWAWQGQRERLWAAVGAEVARLGPPPKDAPEHDPRRILATALNYLQNNLTRMNYPLYRKLGLPISSAPMESTVKRFNLRVKGTEKFWLRTGLEAVLLVRAAYLSEDGRADRYWHRPRPRYRAVGSNRRALAA